MLSGCVQDRWFREVNEATIRVLARNGWRVLVPRRPGVLRRAPGAQRTAGHRPAPGATQRGGLRRRGSRRGQRGGVRRPHARLRRPRGRPRAAGPRPDGVPVRGGADLGTERRRPGDGRLPRRLPCPARPARSGGAEGAATAGPRDGGRRDRERRPLLRRRRALQRHRARDVAAPHAREGRSRSGHRRCDRRERESRVHAATPCGPA